jgi:hypothetical protein
MENFELVLEKCKNIWFDLEKRKRIRRKEGLFTDYDLDVIDKKINWINREKDNIKEKVMYMAHEIFEPPFCPITKEKISCYNPLYRNYTDEMIKNKCFIISKKIKQKMLSPFYENYSKEELEKVLKTITNNVAVRYPMIINHCWISLKEKGIDINLIESNDSQNYINIYADDELNVLAENYQNTEITNVFMVYVKTDSAVENKVIFDGDPDSSFYRLTSRETIQDFGFNYICIETKNDLTSLIENKEFKEDLGNYIERILGYSIKINQISIKVGKIKVFTNRFISEVQDKSKESIKFFDEQKIINLSTNALNNSMNEQILLALWYIEKIRSNN